MGQVITPGMVHPAVGEDCKVGSRNVPKIPVDAEIRLTGDETRVKEGLADEQIIEERICKENEGEVRLTVG